MNSVLHFTKGSGLRLPQELAHDFHVKSEFEKKSDSSTSDLARSDSCNVHSVVTAPEMMLDI